MIAAGVINAVYSPDGTRILTASADGTAQLWEADTGKNIMVLEGHTDIIQDAVDCIFIKNAEVAVGQEIKLKGFQLETGIFGYIIDGYGAKVGKACFRAYRRKFRHLHRDLIV